jgi:hypothetical protein
MTQVITCLPSKLITAFGLRPTPPEQRYMTPSEEDIFERGVAWGFAAVANIYGMTLGWEAASKTV